MQQAIWACKTAQRSWESWATGFESRVCVAVVHLKWWWMCTYISCACWTRLSDVHGKHKAVLRYLMCHLAKTTWDLLSLCFSLDWKSCAKLTENEVSCLYREGHSGSISSSLSATRDSDGNQKRRALCGLKSAFRRKDDRLGDRRRLEQRHPKKNKQI